MRVEYNPKNMKLSEFMFVFRGATMILLYKDIDSFVFGEFLTHSNIMNVINFLIKREFRWINKTNTLKL